MSEPADKSLLTILPEKQFVDDEKLLACVHCGFCLPACPTHVLSGKEMPSPRGRLYLMRAVQEGRLEASDESMAEQQWTCLVCRACETACPAGVEFGFLEEQTRDQLRKVHPVSPVQRFIYTKLLKSKPMLRVLHRATSLATSLGLSSPIHALGTLLKKSFPRFSAALRLMPRSVDAPKKRPDIYPALGARRGRVGLLLGCVGDVFTSRVNDATIRVLTKLGYDVHTIPSITCCGALGIHAGFRDNSIELAKHLIAEVEKSGVDHYVANIAGCGAMLKDYEALLEHSPWAERATNFRARVRDISEFLFEQHYEELLRMGLRSDRALTVGYHAACHLHHAQKVTESPLALLSVLGNVRAVALAENELCCGSAGSYNIEHPTESEQLLDRKMRIIAEAKPDVVVTGNAGCLMQLQKGVRERGNGPNVRHIIEVFDDVLST